MKPSDTVQRVGYFISLATIFLIPVFFLPFTSEFYDFNKNALLVGSSLVLLVLLAVTYVMERQVKLIRSPFGLPLLAVLATWILSTLLRSPNRVDALIDPGQTGTILGLVLFFLSATNFIRNRRELEIATYTLIASLGLLGFVTVLWSSGLLPQIISEGYLKNSLWTPTGSPISTLVLLVAGLPFVVTLLARERKLNFVSGIMGVSLLLQIAGASLIGFRLLQPANQPVFLSQQAGWAIALETAKASPLFGTGPSTFLSDFTRFRPVTYNLTPNWSLRFTNNSNFYLQLLSTVGILGLAAYLFLVARTYMVLGQAAKAIHNSESPSSRVLSLASAASASLIFASQLFLPPSVTTMAASIFFLVLTVASLKIAGSSLVSEANIDIVANSTSGGKSPILPWVALILALALAIPTIYMSSRVYTAEVIFQQALVAAAANDGKKTYDALLQAMRTNPYRDSYRIVYSQTNLLLANSIASGKDLSEADRNTVTQLIQQAIREAKNAVALNPVKVTNIENLAAVYRNLLNLAQGADAWTVASYRQAILLDPVNPNLRIAMGGVLYALKQYDEALNFFQQAVDLKPDLANAHYNLAATYREMGDLEKALTSMQTTVQLVNRDSADYARAAQELDELKAKVGDESPKATSQPQPSSLTTPAPIPSPIVSPRIQLPESLAPDAPATPASQP